MPNAQRITIASRAGASRLIPDVPPPAPATFSMMTGCPSEPRMRSPRRRAIVSVSVCRPETAR